VSTSPVQGELWWAEAEDKRRPVLVVTRTEAIAVLTWLVVAPVSRTIRDIPTEIRLGPRHGLPDDCVASMDNLQPLRRSFLSERIGWLGADGTDEICRGLRALADC